MTKSLDDDKAEDIVAIDLANKSSIGDHMVIATGRSARQVAAMADDFERRYRHLQADVFRPGDTPIAWIALAVAYLRFSDENSNPRSLDQQDPGVKRF